MQFTISVLLLTALLLQGIFGVAVLDNTRALTSDLAEPFETSDKSLFELLTDSSLEVRVLNTFKLLTQGSNMLTRPEVKKELETSEVAKTFNRRQRNMFLNAIFGNQGAHPHLIVHGLDPCEKTFWESLSETLI